MERGEKSGGDGAEKEENLGEKLRRGVLISKRGGPCTPVRILGFARATIITKNPSSSSSSPFSPSGPVSARKLAAALWEFHLYLPSSKMHRGTVTNGPPRLRRLKGKDDDGGGLEVSHFMGDTGPSSPDQPASASSLRRHVTASLMQHHRSIERINQAIQPVSPVSYGSSMEVTPYNPAITPSSSLDLRGRGNEPHYSLKTSTELLKVLNRIWSLEEQHASNISLIKALKTELDHARLRIKELLRDQQADRREIDALMKQIAEDKQVRKSKELDKIHAAIQSARDELDDERKLRKRSESLHRKLARELSDAKASLSKSLQELENERKSRKLLEDLCDEFAVGIRDYEHMVHSLKQKSEQEWTHSEHNRLILHVSESWLDERMQMKLEEAQSGFAEKRSIAEKLNFELETFLQAKKKVTPSRLENILPKERRNSLESVPLNEATSAPQDFGGEDDSDGNDSNCFELKRQSNEELKPHEDEAADGHIDEKTETDMTQTKVMSRGRRKPRNPSNLQVKFEEQMARALSSNRYKDSQAASTEKEKQEVKGFTSDTAVNDFIKNQLMVSGAGCVHPEIEHGEASCSNSTWRNQASPVRQWMAKLSSPDLDIAESASKLPPASKETTLKAKLMEARTKGHRSWFKISKGFS